MPAWTARAVGAPRPIRLACATVNALVHTALQADGGHVRPHLPPKQSGLRRFAAVNGAEAHQQQRQRTRLWHVVVKRSC